MAYKEPGIQGLHVTFILYTLLYFIAYLYTNALLKNTLAVIEAYINGKKL